MIRRVDWEMGIRLGRDLSVSLIWTVYSAGFSVAFWISCAIGICVLVGTGVSFQKKIVHWVSYKN